MHNFAICIRLALWPLLSGVAFYLVTKFLLFISVYGFGAFIPPLSLMAYPATGIGGTLVFSALLWILVFFFCESVRTLKVAAILSAIAGVWIGVLLSVVYIILSHLNPILMIWLLIPGPLAFSIIGIVCGTLTAPIAEKLLAIFPS